MSIGNQGRNSDSAEAGGGEEYLVFRLGQQEYAIDILKVQEIRSYEKPTAIANAPPFIKGVINLRGTIVPIVDLRIKFAVGSADYTPVTVVIVLNFGQRTVGIVVDGVSDVLTLSPNQIRPPPEFSEAVNTQCILGLATLDERMLTVLDIARLMLSPDMALVDEAVAA